MFLVVDHHHAAVRLNQLHTVHRHRTVMGHKGQVGGSRPAPPLFGQHFAVLVIPSHRLAVWTDQFQHGVVHQHLVGIRVFIGGNRRRRTHHGIAVQKEIFRRS